MALPDWLLSEAAAAEFYTSERCHIAELLNNDASPQVSLALARVEPGVTTQLHALRDIAETCVLRSGSGVMTVDGEHHPVSPGDRIIIAAGQSQQISNTGAVDLEFYCVCTPRFRPECYINLEADQA